MLTLGCNSVQHKNEPQIYLTIELYDWINGYQAESNEPNYTDNHIYNECLEIVFEYSYHKDSITKYFEGEMMRDWTFIDKKTLEDGHGVKQIKLTATNPNDNYNNPPQSAVKYDYFNAHGEWLGNESTGVVENYSNIVLHNTRSGFFRSLFSFPWPTVKFPIEDNRTWEWKFAYSSDVYGDSRLFDWEGITEMNYTYKYIGDEILKLNFGEVETSKFEAIGTDGVIKNKLIYNFNSKLGFVKQIFHTHDGATVELVAVEYTDKCK